MSGGADITGSARLELRVNQSDLGRMLGSSRSRVNAELKRMEDLAKSSSLAELQAAEPILRQIADDPSVINVVRARARNLTERMTH